MLPTDTKNPWHLFALGIDFSYEKGIWDEDAALSTDSGKTKLFRAFSSQ